MLAAESGRPGLESLEIMQLELPLLARFTTAAGSAAGRTVILIGATRAGRTGWGECAPFPGHSPDTADAAWSSLMVAAPMLTGAPGGLDAADLTPTAAAALDEAMTDLAARESDTPLWRYLGGTQPSITAGWVAAAGGEPEATVAAVAKGVEHGHVAFKIKVVAGSAKEAVQAVMATFPSIVVGADANGAFSPDDTAELRALDRLGLDYLEQPFPVGAESATRQLAAAMETRIAIDESVSTVALLDEAIGMRTADILVVKAGHLGSRRAADAIERVIDAGLTPRIGGLVETMIGRRHALALATLVPTSPAPDLAAGSPYFAVEPVPPSIVLDQGFADAGSAAGTGTVVDHERVAAFTARRMMLS